MALEHVSPNKWYLKFKASIFFKKRGKYEKTVFPIEISQVIGAKNDCRLTKKEIITLLGKFSVFYTLMLRTYGFTK